MAKTLPTNIADLCSSIVDTIKDYRKGEIDEPSLAHVQRWLQQFPANKRLGIAKEMDHLLSETYYSKRVVKQFLESLTENDELLEGMKPAKFWKRVNVIRVQNTSRSQSDLLNILGGILHTKFGFWSRDCGSATGPYFYLDDFIFTGRTVRRELLAWLKEESPDNPKINIAVLAYHTYGQYYASKEIAPVIKALGGGVTFWRAAEIEDRKSASGSCDVFRPRKIYSDDIVQDYANGFKYPPALRNDDTNSSVYCTENGRRTLEYEFLRAGLRIRRSCENPEAAMRPLGFSSLDGFGSGAIVATYRNCPNNSPLAWWWGDPSAPKHHPLSKWYPLLPRKYTIR